MEVEVQADIDVLLARNLLVVAVQPKQFFLPFQELHILLLLALAVLAGLNLLPASTIQVLTDQTPFFRQLQAQAAVVAVETMAQTLE